MRRWLGAAGVVIVVIAVAAVALGGTSERHLTAAPDPPRSTVEAPASEPTPPVVPGPTIRVGSTRTLGPPVRPGFLGFSFEFQAVRVYTGADPAAINPVLVQLIRNLTPGQAPVIRIGGDSSDISWVPTRGVIAPPYVSYRLTPSWLATTAALAHTLGARMTMGLNLAADQPRLAGAEARAFARVLGSGSLAALEIGNEPNVYSKIQLLHTLLGAPLYARPRDYGYRTFLREYRAEAATAPAATMWGPALAVGPTPEAGSWLHAMPDFLRRNPNLPVMTVHRYPLRNCFVPPTSPQYPTVAHLLSDYSTTGLAAGLRPWIGLAHARRRALRVDELNSVACRGKAGVSDVFASALWITDALFSLVHARVDGVNMHTLPHSAYELFAFQHGAGGWEARVRPVYYGLQLFAQAAPPGSRLLPVSGLGHTPALSVWATRANNGSVRMVLINRSTRANRTLAVRPPPGLNSTATIERLTAPSVHAQHGITLGGRSYGATTGTGRLRPFTITSMTRHGRAFALALPRSSAALVTLTPH